MKRFRYISAALGLSLFMSACDDLDQYPKIEVSSDKVYATTESSASVLAACYASFSYNVADLPLPGKNEPLIRSVFNLQEGTTDAMAYTWLTGDELGPLTYNTWDENQVWITYVWYRNYVVVTTCNDFIKNTKGSSDPEIQNMILEARYLRALSLYYILDCFGKGVIPTDETAIGDSNLPEKSGKELYEYITDELEEIAPKMSSTVAYPRATKGAAYALLSRIYLNSKTYAGVAEYDKCVKASDNCEAEGYVLEPTATYHQLFGADNDKHAGVGKEIIFAFEADPDNARSWAGATNIMCGFASGDGLLDAILGISKGWGSQRMNKAFSDLFVEEADIRTSYVYKMRKNGDEVVEREQLVSVEDDSKQGYLSIKFHNLRDDGTAAISLSTQDRGCATDLPIFRLAEVKLNKAEALYRQGKADEAKAIFDVIRQRVGASTSYELNDQFILDERGRELAYECVRRTDLIRFNKYAGDVDYNWEFKGGVASGKNIEAYRNLFPIPARELSANQNLSQNVGY